MTKTEYLNSVYTMGTFLWKSTVPANRRAKALVGCLSNLEMLCGFSRPTEFNFTVAPTVPSFLDLLSQKGSYDLTTEESKLLDGFVFMLN